MYVACQEDEATGSLPRRRDFTESWEHMYVCSLPKRRGYWKSAKKTRLHRVMSTSQEDELGV